MATTSDILTSLKAFAEAFHMKNSFKPPEFYWDVEEHASIYGRDIDHLQNPIRAPWWFQVIKDDILATCDKSLADFFIPRLRNGGTAEARRLSKLAESYEKGDGVEKDIQIAFSYYLTAAELGDVDAQIAIGFALMSGRFETVDEKAAFGWFLKAATVGNPRAAYFTGLCYDRGTGVEKNEEFANAYFRYAAAYGDEDAKDLL